ncbi:hypothetical protein NQ314_020065 [Rhamnusium bicolor]|uniref:Uncharacterized protein n=1 Tax=Rhamnusium bicolor TaxID=1586634 RepID=A0AAV8WM96_9CUCU|nr:hypothetical protein NQ314_020065 [Rhamnusium bicolor]
MKSNLEVVNLKQRILDITKHSNMEMTLNATQNIAPKYKKDEIVLKEVKLTLEKLEAIIDPSKSM